MVRVWAFAALLAGPASAPAADAPDVRLFLEAASTDARVAAPALEKIGRGWSDDYASLVLDLLRFTRPSRPRLEEGDFPLDPEEPAPRPDAFPPPDRARPDPTGPVRDRLVRFLEKQTGQRFGHDLKRWRLWVWNRPYRPHPDYTFFKAALYSGVDRRMASFFSPGATALIRLDEVDWGGVSVDGIPPLDHPRVVSAREAGWLKDGHVVFGIESNGEARAYPRRILAWHELARDRVGGVELTIVYCTLCGTVIPYASVAGGRLHTLGTSGLLYRSNKLMYDRETSSLWSTVEGRPVLGPLADTGVELTPLPVVTTTWKEWRTLHPDTTVLSRDTGHDRDYSEGAAYRDYFATDRLMFGVPLSDDRLRNKDEVLAALLPPAGAPEAERRPLALSVEFLRRHPVHRLAFEGHALVALTTPAGANRLYDAGGVTFVRWRPDGTVEDGAGRPWRVGEDSLRLVADPAQARPRIAARRAFWFGWHAQFPQTVLVK
jgi:hypothetical protein